MKTKVMHNLKILNTAKNKGISFDTLSEITDFSNLDNMPDSIDNSYQNLKRLYLLNTPNTEEILFSENKELKEAYNTIGSIHPNNTARLIEFYNFFIQSKTPYSSVSRLLSLIQEILNLEILPLYTADSIVSNYTFIKNNNLDLKYLALEKIKEQSLIALKSIQLRTDFDDIILLFTSMENHNLFYTTLTVDKPLEILKLLPDITKREICTYSIFSKPVLLKELKSFLNSGINHLSSEREYFGIIYPYLKNILNLVSSDRIEDTLIFAARNRKKVFIELCNKYIDKFRLSNTYKSILFSDEFRNIVNLNSINEVSFLKLLDISDVDVLLEHISIPLSPEEVISLKHSDKYTVDFYSLLSCNIDSKLRILKEIENMKLSLNLNTETMERLASTLSQNSLSQWREYLFKNNSSISLPAIFNALKTLLPQDIRQISKQIKSDIDLLFSVKYYSSVVKYGIETAKYEYIHTSDEVKKFLTSIEVSDITSFTSNYSNNLIQFIENGLLDTYNKLSATLTNKLKKNILKNLNRITKAKLMDKLEMLKFNDNDLNKEIRMDISPDIEKLWKDNNSFKNSFETYDYKTLLEIGINPIRTCMNYEGGSYSHCLLSNFDSNKKVIVNQSGSKINARAILRLTKSSTLKPSDLSTMLEFIDVEKVYSNIKVEDKKQEILDSKKLTLFLEKPYIADNTDPNSIKEEFITLVIEKAKALRARLVFSPHYDNILKPTKLGENKNIWIYISKSKNGFQYLDSFGGVADEYAGGKYKDASFYVIDFS